MLRTNSSTNRTEILSQPQSPRYLTNSTPLKTLAGTLVPTCSCVILHAPLRQNLYLLPAQMGPAKRHISLRNRICRLWRRAKLNYFHRWTCHNWLGIFRDIHRRCCHHTTHPTTTTEAHGNGIFGSYLRDIIRRGSGYRRCVDDQSVLEMVFLYQSSRRRCRNGSPCPGSERHSTSQSRHDT